MLIAFVDECKAGSYSLAVALVHAGDLKFVRRELQAHRRLGQSRIHFAKESDSRRREILSAIKKLPVETFVISSNLKHAGVAREDCLGRLVIELIELGVGSLVLEDDHLVSRNDRLVIARTLLGLRFDHDFSYRHEAPHFEPCLWIPDAIAWANQKGGVWRKKASLN